MTYNYIINNKDEVVVEPDLLKWGRWMEDATRKIQNSETKKYSVSTVFLGIDYSFGIGEPLLFETMVFEKKISKSKAIEKPVKIRAFEYHKSLDEYTRRYATKAEALKGHEEVLKEVKLMEKKK